MMRQALDRRTGKAEFKFRIEKIGANTEFKLSFTSPSIEELASSFRTDGHRSMFYIYL